MFIRGRFVAEMSEPEDFAVSKKICMLKVWCFFRQFVAFFLLIDLHVHVCYPDAITSLVMGKKPHTKAHVAIHTILKQNTSKTA